MAGRGKHAHISFHTLILSVACTSLIVWSHPAGINVTEARVSDHCGGRINDTRGFIHTPHFPASFPLPLSCTWVLYAPPGTRMVLYFTQFYVRRDFHLAEYDLYVDDSFYVGKYDLGEVVFERRITSVVSYKPYLVVRFSVDDMTNLHIRVKQFLLDVYGFNITYELMDEGQETARADACSVFQCSFLGSCLASADFTSYRCECYEGFSGDQCQFGPYCDAKGIHNGCFNGGKCRYYEGTDVNTCDCPPGYGGDRCHVQQHEPGPDCGWLGCDQRCDVTDNTTTCTCDDGYRLAPDGLTCLESSPWRYAVRLRVIPLNSTSAHDLCDNCGSVVLNAVGGMFRAEGIEVNNLTLVGTIRGPAGDVSVDVSFTGEGRYRSRIWLTLTALLHSPLNSTSHHFDPQFLIYDPQPVLRSVVLENPDVGAATEDRLLTLVCRYKGPAHSTVTWLKDGVVLDVDRSERNMWVSHVVGSDDETQIVELNIEYVHRFDEGTFSSRVSDGYDVAVRSLYVHVVPFPYLKITPPASYVTRATPVALTCISRDDEFHRFSYSWLRDGAVLPVSGGSNGEVVEQLIPTGSRLNLRSVHVRARYTCVVHSAAGRRLDTALVDVIDDSGARVCPGEVYREVQWQTTSGGGDDVQLCPRNAEAWFDMCQHRACKHTLWKTGRARRRCHCEEEACQWREPDFTNCTSVEMDLIWDKFTRLSLGYQVTSVSVILRQLRQFLESETDLMMTGDLRRTLQLLQAAQSYLSVFRSVSNDSHIQDSRALVRLVMTKKEFISPQEDEELQLTLHLMRYLEYLVRDEYFKNVHHFSLIPGIKITSVQNNTTVIHGAGKLHTELHASPQNETVPCAVFRVVTYDKELVGNTTMLHHRSLSSELVYVDVVVDEQTRSTDYPPPFTLHFPLMQNVSGHKQEVTCAALTFSEGVDGEWSEDSCQQVNTSQDVVQCVCQWPGYYSLLTTTPQQKEIDVVPEPQGGTVLLAGAVFSVLVFTTSVLARSCLWRQLEGDSKTISLNFSFVMIAVSCILIGGFSSTGAQVMCTTVRLAMFALLASAASFTLAEAQRLYEASTCKKHTGSVKYTAMGYGLPMVLVLVLVISGHSVGYTSFPSTVYCWFCVGSWEMFTFTVFILLVFIAFCMFTAFTFTNIMCTKDRNSAEKKGLMFYVRRSMLSTVCLCVMIATSFPLACDHSLAVEYTFTTALITLALSHTLLFKPQAMSIFLSWYKCHHKCAGCVHKACPNAAVKTGERARRTMTVRDKWEETTAITATDVAFPSAGIQISTPDEEVPSEGVTITRPSAIPELHYTPPQGTACCACPQCVKTYPFKPLRGRSYIHDHASPTQCVSSQVAGPSCHRPLYQNVTE